MAVETRAIAHNHDGIDFESLVVADPAAGPRPLVLIFATIMGRSDHERAAAERLVGLGYAALACDLYGKDRIGLPREECRPLMQALIDDRPRLQSRMLALLEAARGLPDADPGRIAAIGYCFGGLCALDLARTGADVRGTAAFHGLLKAPGNLAGTKIKAKVAVFHGWDDPLAPPDDVEALGRELSETGADWQIHAYGGVAHSFTNPNAASPEQGLVYSASANARSWQSLVPFLQECFEAVP